MTKSKSALDQLVAERVAEAKTKFLRQTVLSILYKRFLPIEVPKKIKSAVRRLNDPIVLEILLYEAAVDCETLDEFAETLNGWVERGSIVVKSSSKHLRKR
jgi:hypothetical protein